MSTIATTTAGSRPRTEALIAALITANAARPLTELGEGARRVRP
ncbi:hypothetical protein [Microbacterium sp. A84]